ncbi:uncharacterized protein TNCT_580581 [Trichonephila clavata]|uniref:Schwannomin interacting protein 1 C-terminal domain-containing protein n=1 Tax=Trichonephila clavata TaxID=2740835 RepID=A0A8X6LHL9_TRICU|nr:uncharacterized protein TNCT_580581 [Trichonephila clavata]
MPAHNNTESTQPTEVYLLDMKEILTLDSKGSEIRNISDIVDALNSSSVLKGVSSNNTCDIDRNVGEMEVLKQDNDDVPVAQFTNFSKCCKDNSDISSNIISLKISDSLTKSLKCNQSAQFRKYSKKTISEFDSYSIKELQILLEDLSRAVEAVSGELVQLLLENDALQQESDARNIAIEQLLQLAVKNSENELKPVQMSVILPSEESDPI